MNDYKQQKRCPFYRCERGSFTLESGLIYPILLLIIVSFLFASIHVYQQTMTLFIAQQSSERSAYAWSQQGSLYEGALHSIAEMMKGAIGLPSATYTLHADRNQSFSGAKGKLAQAASFLPNQITTATYTYQNQLWSRKISAQLDNQTAIIPFASRLLNNGKITSIATAHIVDPVQWMRTRDFVLYYGQTLHDKWVTPQQADHAIQRFFGMKEPNSFDTEREASVYLRKIVIGVEEKKTTSKGVRKIDARDEEGMVHQAYLTFRENQLLTQLDKDVALLAEFPEFKGVVWHFFRKTGQQGKVGPSASFLAKLQQHGIAYVIHDV